VGPPALQIIGSFYQCEVLDYILVKLYSKLIPFFQENIEAFVSLNKKYKYKNNKEGVVPSY
jgi:hypothetical protein